MKLTLSMVFYYKHISIHTYVCVVKNIFNNTEEANSPLHNHDLIKLEFMCAKGWLGCPDSVCDLCSCSYGSGRIEFSSCHGELFRIVVENSDPVRSGD